MGFGATAVVLQNIQHNIYQQIDRVVWRQPSVLGF